MVFALVTLTSFTDVAIDAIVCTLIAINAVRGDAVCEISKHIASVAFAARTLRCACVAIHCTLIAFPRSRVDYVARFALIALTSFTDIAIYAIVCTSVALFRNSIHYVASVASVTRAQESACPAISCTFSAPNVIRWHRIQFRWKVTAFAFVARSFRCACVAKVCTLIACPRISIQYVASFASVAFAWCCACLAIVCTFLAYIVGSTCISSFAYGALTRKSTLLAVQCTWRAMTIIQCVARTATIAPRIPSPV